MKTTIPKIAAIAIVALIFTVSFLSCKKETSANTFLTLKKQALRPPDSKDLSLDENFKTMVLSTESLIEVIAEEAKAKQLNLAMIQQKLGQLQSEGQFIQIDKMNELFKSDLTAVLKNHMTAVRNWDAMKKKYSNVNAQLIEDATKKVLFNKLLDHLPIPSSKIEVLKKKYWDTDVSKLEEASQEILMEYYYAEDSYDYCKWWKYTICSIGVTAGAILCHAACDTTALATTAGLGIPVCFALCLSVQTAGMLECAERYCPLNN